MPIVEVVGGEGLLWVRLGMGLVGGVIQNVGAAGRVGFLQGRVSVVGRGERRGLGGQAEVSEDAGEHRWVGEEGQDDHGRGTSGTPEGVDGEDAQEKLRPGEPGASGPRGWSSRKRAGLGGRWFLTHRRGGGLLSQRLASRRRGRQARTQGGASGEETVVAYQMGVGSRDQRGQTAQQVVRFEHQRGDTLGVGPGTPQVVDEAPVGKAGEPLL